MIGRIVQCFGVERTPATSRFATGADLESAREQELAEEAALLRAENARLVSELVEAQRALEHARLKAQLAALRTPGPATAAAANPRSQLSLIASPAITSPGARVQRRALSNVVRKGRNSALVIYCFDVWRMLMFCRVQHDVDKEEILRLRREHERDVAQLQKMISARAAIDACNGEISGGELFRDAASPKTADSQAVAALMSPTLSALLDAGENAMRAAEAQAEAALQRVDELERDKLAWQAEKAALLQHLHAVQAEAEEASLRRVAAGTVVYVARGSQPVPGQRTPGCSTESTAQTGDDRMAPTHTDRENKENVSDANSSRQSAAKNVKAKVLGKGAALFSPKTTGSSRNHTPRAVLSPIN